MRLSALVAAAVDAPGTLDDRDGVDPEIRSVAHDTRSVSAGALFCCVPGATVDGHELIGAAVRAGAVAALVEHPVAGDIPTLEVPSVRRAMGPVSAAFWDHPSRSLHVVGITGTSGKTTTAHLLGALLDATGWSTSVLGTLSGPRTTPEAPELQARLAAERDAGRAVVAMEVSSHALVMGRVRGTRFRVAVFTNLSHDHLDFHGDIDAYFEAKASLFTPGYTDAAVVNLDDPRGQALARRGLVPTEGYSLDDATDVEIGVTSSRFRWRGHPVHLRLGGHFNVSNAIGAATAAGRLGLDDRAIAEGLSAAPPVPGRFEPIDEGQPFAVIVDYSHKPDALAGALVAARAATDDGRVILVVGAGGDRDRGKRPEMGEVAARLADVVLLTSDNPRSEDPMAIIDSLRSGMPVGATATIEPDRAAAISTALAAAGAGDVVLIAGKGHETLQVVGDRKLPFDDRAVARDALRSLRGSQPW